MENYVITISRLFGSMGHDIAERMGEMLEIPVYDRSSVEARVQSLGILEAEKKKEMEKREKASQAVKAEKQKRSGGPFPKGRGKGRSLARKRPVQSQSREHEQSQNQELLHEAEQAQTKDRKKMLPLNALFEKRAEKVKADAEAQVLFDAQAQVIRSLAEESSCIILGRGGDQIFHGKERCLNIFIYAPDEARIRNCIEFLHTSPEAAKSLIETEDRVRDTYRGRFCPDVKSMIDGRHLCIDSSRLGLEESAKLCVEAAKYLFYERE